MPENRAFTQSLKFSYEELDKKLLESMHEPPCVFIVNVPGEEGDDGSIQQLSAAETRARLAELNLNRKRTAAALSDIGQLRPDLAIGDGEHPAAGVSVDVLNQNAREAFERAIGVDPEYLRAWAVLARLFECCGSPN